MGSTCWCSHFKYYSPDSEHEPELYVLPVTTCACMRWEDTNWERCKTNWANLQKKKIHVFKTDQIFYEKKHHGQWTSFRHVIFARYRRYIPMLNNECINECPCTKGKFGEIYYTLQLHTPVSIMSLCPKTSATLLPMVKKE